MNTTRRITAIAATLGALASAGLAVAPTASATTYNGCVYPRVCFYLTGADWNRGTPTAAYQDVTTSNQNLSSRALGENDAARSPWCAPTAARRAWGLPS
ncbi:hypothetical protein ACFCZT_39825 [Streptomyces sp. NPDC056230]|uniref:hypothetical protein n=1 Tax=Streptomyces sp. NPDC056230 TaxID=3345754 RepID=UPI0035D57CCD